jgi:hypothetical protein
MARIDPSIPLSTQLGFEDFTIAPISPETPRTEAIEEIPYQEGTFNTNEVQELCKKSLDFLAATAIPTVFKYSFPPTFVQIWVWLLSNIHKVRDFSQLAIGLPRGFGKTMLIKIFILYTVLFTKKQFILVICGTQTKANNIIADVIGMLNEKNIKSVFGDWSLGAEIDRQDLKKFGFRGRTIILMGAGAESDIRGITLENTRPDVMIFDDIQTREDADSDIVSAKLETWMIGTAMKAKSPEGCLFVFIANMYPTKHSLLRKIKHNPTWTKFIVGGILANGTSLWEDLQPISQLLKEYQNDLSMGKPEIFHAEVLNDENASVNNFIDISKVPINPYHGESLHQGNYVIIDPATDKANADAVSIGYFELFDSKPVTTHIIEGRLSPGETAAEAIKLCLTRQCRLIVVESNAYQYVLGWIIKQELSRLGITGIEVVDIYSGSTSKNARILTMFKQLLSGEILLHESVRALCFNQVVSFNPLKTNNTDGILDLLTYAPRVIEMYGEFITSSLTIEMQEFSAIPVRGELETSVF